MCQDSRSRENVNVAWITESSDLRTLGLSAGVIDILDREIKFVLVPLWVATIFTAAVGQHPQHFEKKPSLVLPPRVGEHP
jgi:hypothetical protein